ncbi:hypothetical protein [Parasediminibacterium sp. JCM 36343]|uniref:hypothetical protein n=1 Tax=Parasediminibacterium sp. JCM 36343 TaxID=3374279 RepID=UPI003979184B
MNHCFNYKLGIKNSPLLFTNSNETTKELFGCKEPKNIQKKKISEKRKKAIAYLKSSLTFAVRKIFENV